MILEYLLTPKFAVIGAWLSCALFVHYRGQVRHRFMRQLTDHSTFLAPFNALIYLFSKVGRRPFIDTAQFPELQVFRSNWKVIAAEAQALFDQDEIRASAKREDIAFNTFFKRGWKRFYFKWYHDVLPSAEALCPKTTELVRSVPSVHAAMFTLLPPGGELGEHHDPFAGSLRYHLGLITPNDDACRIYVDGKMHSWRDGEHVLFDETYIHSARNDTDQTRIIFFADVARPVHTRAFSALTRFVAKHIACWTSSRNDDSERLGAVNRLAVFVYASKTFFETLKDFNYRLYYAVKYALALGLAYWIFVPKEVFAG
ncbi:MAG: beta-hydroxylase [Planctomycetota bacterium]|jgi:beta-hydroxylase